MPNYQLEIRQLETYPRCRVNQGFVQSLTENRDIHTNGCPGLFSYVVLCSPASSGLMYLRLAGISYTIQPGEWVCALDELKDILRLRTRRQTLNMLWVMQNRGLIQYTLLGRGKIVRFKITDWHFANFVLRDDCLNPAPGGFFFLSALIAADLIGAVRCSEMDILLDILFSAVYRDSRVKGSYTAPAVYFRNEDSSALVTCDELSERWGLSHRAVRHVLDKLQDAGYITVHGASWRPEMLIYPADKLSGVFQVSDIMMDKDELPAIMCVDLPVAENDLAGLEKIMADRVLQLLSLQGFSCPKCHRCRCDLRPLSGTEDVLDKPTRYRMDISCARNTPIYAFELCLYPGQQ